MNQLENLFYELDYYFNHAPDTDQPTLSIEHYPDPHLPISINLDEFGLFISENPI